MLWDSMNGQKQNRIDVEDSVLRLIMGCSGLGPNVVVMSFIHGTNSTSSAPGWI